MLHAFPRVVVHRVKRARSIRHPRIISQVHEVVLRQARSNLTEYRQPANTRVKYSNGSWVVSRLVHQSKSSIANHRSQITNPNHKSLIKIHKSLIIFSHRPSTGSGPGLRLHSAPGPSAPTMFGEEEK